MAPKRKAAAGRQAATPVAKAATPAKSIGRKNALTSAAEAEVQARAAGKLSTPSIASLLGCRNAEPVVPLLGKRKEAAEARDDAGAGAKKKTAAAEPFAD